MAFTRRFFLKSSGVAMVGMGAHALGVPPFLARAAVEAERQGKTLVVVFLRGAADGLNLVIPHGDPNYYRLRPSIAIARPRRGEKKAAVDLDGFFGLHPQLAPLKPLYDSKQLAIITAAGSPDSTRSHFDAQDFMESGTPGIKNTDDGWLNRYLREHPREAASSFRAVSVTSQMPRILSGEAGALSIPSLATFGLDQARYSKLVRRGLESLYEGADDPLLVPTARETFEAVDLLKSVDPTQHRPAAGVTYPKGGFGSALLQVAQLIKSKVGLEIAFAELGGWDTHLNQGSIAGPMANKARELAKGLAAFSQDLGDRMEDVVVVTLSEFGRTAAENGNRGTDHGHGNSIFILGGGIQGGKIYGEWPGLDRDQLYERRDLALTSDFRDVLAEVLRGHLGAENLGGVFPGFSRRRAPIGLFGV